MEYHGEHHIHNQANIKRIGWRRRYGEWHIIVNYMMTSNGNIFRVTGPLCVALFRPWQASFRFVYVPFQENKTTMWSRADTSKLTFHLSSRDLSLHWRHNDRNGVTNHQPHGCLLNRLFRRRSKKTSKLRVTGLCVWNSPGPVNSPHKEPVTRKMFPFDDVIM